MLRWDRQRSVLSDVVEFWATRERIVDDFSRSVFKPSSVGTHTHTGTVTAVVCLMLSLVFLICCLLWLLFLIVVVVGFDDSDRSAFLEAQIDGYSQYYCHVI